MANYEPTVTIAESSTLHRHTIYYPVHASFMQEVIKALENLSILAENASTIESQALVAQTLMSVSLQSSQSLQYGKTHTTFLKTNYAVYFKLMFTWNIYIFILEYTWNIIYLYILLNLQFFQVNKQYKICKLL